MGLKLPVFEEKTGAFVITFYKERKSGGISGGVSGGVEDKITSLIKKQPGINAPAIAESLGKPKRTIERYLTQLKAKQIIEFRGSPKSGGYYFV